MMPSARAVAATVRSYREHLVYLPFFFSSGHSNAWPNTTTKFERFSRIGGGACCVCLFLAARRRLFGFLFSPRTVHHHSSKRRERQCGWKTACSGRGKCVVVARGTGQVQQYCDDNNSHRFKCTIQHLHRMRHSALYPIACSPRGPIRTQPWLASRDASLPTGSVGGGGGAGGGGAARGHRVTTPGSGRGQRFI